MNVKRSLLAIFIIIFLASMSNADEIHLKDGRIIKAEMCWKEDNKYHYKKYGATVSFPEEKVLKIVQSDDLANKNKPKQDWQKILEARNICYGECEITKLICKNENEKTSKECVIEERQCQIDCHIEHDFRPKFNTSWQAKSKGQSKNYKNKILDHKNTLAELKNLTDEQWEKICERYHKNFAWIKDCRSLEIFKEEYIQRQDRRIERWEKFQVNTGVLDINTIDLSKFTVKAKNDRENEIEQIRLKIAKSNYPVISNYRLEILGRLMQTNHDLILLEIAFMEEFGLDIQEEAEKSITMN